MSTSASTLGRWLVANGSTVGVLVAVVVGVAVVSLRATSGAVAGPYTASSAAASANDGVCADKLRYYGFTVAEPGSARSMHSKAAAIAAGRAQLKNVDGRMVDAYYALVTGPEQPRETRAMWVVEFNGLDFTIGIGGARQPGSPQLTYQVHHILRTLDDGRDLAGVHTVPCT